jgi:hypothetical protein
MNICGENRHLRQAAKRYIMTPMTHFKSHLKTLAALMAMSFVSFSCSTSTEITSTNYHITKTPPGVVKISGNFFCDQKEICNVDWREYMSWVKRVFGVHSIAYTATLPDTVVWAKTFSCLASYEDNYLRKPEFDYFPVVGITQQQARNFSKWRADRVFEKLLVDLNKIKYDPAQNSKTYFSIEKYFNGTYRNTKPNKKITYFPEYRLPSLSERKQIVQYADTVDSMYFDTCTSEYCLVNRKNFPLFWSDVRPCINDSIEIKPTVDARIPFSATTGHPIYNFRGHVGEWAAETGVTFGGSWFNSRQAILQSDTFHVDRQNCWTGFRNVCEWKPWKE